MHEIPNIAEVCTCNMAAYSHEIELENSIFIDRNEGKH